MGEIRHALTINLHENIQFIKTTLGNSPDIVMRELHSERACPFEAVVIYVSGLTDIQIINQFVMSPLLSSNEDEHALSDSMPPAEPLDFIKKKLLAVGEIQEEERLDKLLTGILSGNAAILCQGVDYGLLLATHCWEERGVEEPTSQTVIRGPKEGFSENIATNIALIRRKIKDPNLWLEQFRLGEVTKTGVAIMYINGIANDKVLQEVRNRIGRIRLDGILESGYIEEFIQDSGSSVFPTVYNTERPDVIAANLLEGRIAILVDGTPFTLIVPAVFTQFLQSAEDYYQRADISSLIRLLRYVALAIALLAPSLYIAITTYHHDLLPPGLLISLIAQREGIPFPAFVEALLMEVTFELLREAGIRLPRAVGQSISIVGALVIGQAAVEAGFVSAAMVIVVSITAISSFIIPAYNMAIPIRILRFGVMGLAAAFGLFGILAGIILIAQHLTHLRSFGVPYMSPYAPVIQRDLKDSVIRTSWRHMITRPRSISKQKQNREGGPQSLHQESKAEAEEFVRKE